MSSRKTVVLLGILCVCLSASALSPVGTHGRLKVTAGKIVGAKDNLPVQLAGMSLFWSLWEGEKYYNRKVVSWLVHDWNISIIRACLGIGQGAYEGEDQGNAEAQYNKIVTIVDAAIAHGIYVIVDFHAHDANLTVDKAKKFFGDISKQYAGVPNIIWEIWNEPDDKNGSGIVFPDQDSAIDGTHWDNWSDIKEYAAEIIPVIRANSDNLIVVGTPSWSQHVDTAAADPLDYPDIAYTLHFYAAWKLHQDTLRLRAQTALDLGAALFITEFGSTNYDGGSDGIVDSVQTDIWLDWADSNAISWVNWSIVDKGEASAALRGGASDTGGWTDDQLTASGMLIRSRLKNRPAYDFSDIVPDDGKSVPGLIEAESFVAKSNDLKTDAASDAGGGQCLGYTRNGAWAEYQIVVRKTGTFKARLRVSSAESGTIALKADDKRVAAWTVGTTGGWSTWKTTEYCEPFMFATGTTTLRVEWTGTASSLVNLNWIEFAFVAASNTSDTIPADTGNGIPGDSGSIIFQPDGRTLPGRIEAESLKSKSDGLAIEATSDTEGVRSLGYTTDGAWAEYSVNVSMTGNYTVKYRVAADEGFGGTITMKFDDRPVCSWTCGTTGGWSTWKTIESPDTFTIEKGESVVRIEWSGTASSLVNLNWIEFTYHEHSISISSGHPVSPSRFPVITIDNGMLSLQRPESIEKITLHSLDGRVLTSVTPISRQPFSLPVGNRVVVLAVHTKNQPVRTMRIVKVH